MSDTPRTDAVVGVWLPESLNLQIVEAEFARQLERELNQALQEIQSLEDAIRYGSAHD